HVVGQRQAGSGARPAGASARRRVLGLCRVRSWIELFGFKRPDAAHDDRCVMAPPVSRSKVEISPPWLVRNQSGPSVKGPRPALLPSGQSDPRGAAMNATTALDSIDEVRAPTKKSPIETSACLVAWMIRHRVSLAFSSYQNGDLFFLGAQSDGRAVLSWAEFSYAMGIAAFDAVIRGFRPPRRGSRRRLTVRATVAWGSPTGRGHPVGASDPLKTAVGE